MHHWCVISCGGKSGEIWVLHLPRGVLIVLKKLNLFLLFYLFFVRFKNFVFLLSRLLPPGNLLMIWPRQSLWLIDFYKACFNHFNCGDFGIHFHCGPVAIWLLINIGCPIPPSVMMRNSIWLLWNKWNSETHKKQK